MRLEEPAAELEEPGRSGMGPSPAPSELSALPGAEPRGRCGNPLGAVAWLGPCPLPPFLSLHAVLSTPAWGWNEQAVQARIRPALYTSHWPPSPPCQLLGWEGL